MKILFTSDWHLDRVTAGFERYDDLESAVIATVDAAIEAKVDAYVFCGDLTDPNTSRSYRAISCAIRAAETLSEAGIPSKWVDGNHGVIEDGYGTSMLSPLREIDSGGMVMVFSGVPQLSRIESRNGKESCNALFLPYTARSHGYDPEAYVRQAAAVGGEGPAMVVGHLCIEGIHTGSESSHMARGRNVFFPYEAIREVWPNALLVNGHYHEGQEWRGATGSYAQPIHIPGSIGRMTFGEAGLSPGYLIAEATL